MQSDDKRDISRRAAVGGSAGLLVAGLIGCSDDDVGTSGSGGAGGSGAGGQGSTTGTATGTTTSGATTGSASTTASTGTGSSGGWASGGTAGMTDKASYPDPFQDPLGNACTLTQAMTLGPCYAQTIEREDISEGSPGLPVRLALLVVDTSCNPVGGAVVDIWHTSYEGFYSGEDAPSLCTLDDPEAEAGRWFRGVQTTGADGKVFFDTCFPGWYSGRAIHIHFQVRSGNQTYVTSQLFFAEDLVQEIFSTHPDYSPFGQPDTPNAADGIYDVSGELTTAQMTDGAMLASKVVVVD